MADLWQTLTQLFGAFHGVQVLRALLLLLGGVLLARLLSRTVLHPWARKLGPHHRKLAQRAIYYLVLSLFAVAALRELGFDLSVLLGAAGIFTVALGFASQTSASNLISGLFLLAEQAFSLGDVIKVGDTTGEVIGIDLLSVKLRTFDNLFVRLPNETVIKSQVTNLTRFPIRRLDVQVGVAYKEDIGRVQEVLRQVAEDNPLCLEEPAPLFIFLGFGDSALNLQFSVWSRKESFLDLRNSIYREIKEAFDVAGIEIPFPHRTLYAGSVSGPFPVQVHGAAQDPSSDATPR